MCTVYGVWWYGVWCMVYGVCIETVGLILRADDTLKHDVYLESDWDDQRDIVLVHRGNSLVPGNLWRVLRRA